MEDTHQPDETIIPDWIVAFTLGSTQTNIERYAASFGVPARDITARLGLLLSSATSWPLLGSQGPMPELQRGSRARNSVPQSLALAGYASGKVRRNEPSKNGQLEKGAIKSIVLHALRGQGKVPAKPFLRSLVAQHPDIPLPAFSGTVNRLTTTGLLKRLLNGKIKLTTLGSAEIDDNDDNDEPPPSRKRMSAAARKRISQTQKQRWADKKSDTNSKQPTAQRRGYIPRGQMWQWMKDVVEKHQPIKMSPLADIIAKQHGVKPKTVTSAISRFYDQGLLKSGPEGATITAKGKREGEDELEKKLKQVFRKPDAAARTRELIVQLMRKKGTPMRPRDIYQELHAAHPEVEQKRVLNQLGWSKNVFLKTAKGYVLNKKVATAKPHKSNGSKHPTRDAVALALKAKGPLPFRRDVISAVREENPDMTPKAIEHALVRGVHAKEFAKTPNGFAMAATA
jgi:hypothetical protein